ncbi:hypothetical protein VUR80DRAFT_7215 [Thermomyces stellatus]
MTRCEVSLRRRPSACDRSVGVFALALERGNKSYGLQLLEVGARRWQAGAAPSLRPKTRDRGQCTPPSAVVDGQEDRQRPHLVLGLPWRVSWKNAVAHSTDLLRVATKAVRARVAEFVGSTTPPAEAGPDKVDPGTRLDFGITAPPRCRGRTLPGSIRRRIRADAARYRHAVAFEAIMALRGLSTLFCHSNMARKLSLMSLCSRYRRLYLISA